MKQKNKMRTNLQKGSALIISLVFTVLLIAGVAGLSFLLLRAESATLKGALEIKELAEKRNNVEQLSKLATELKDFRPKLDPYFVNTDTFNLVIERMERLAKTSNVDFRFQSVGKTSFEKRDALAITFIAEGPFNNLMQFVSLLENAQFKLFFNRVDLKLVDLPNATNKNTAWWVASFDATLLSFVEN